jgi:hypothetical protein
MTRELTANSVVLKTGRQSRSNELLVLPSAIEIASARPVRREGSRAETHTVDAAVEARAKRDAWGSCTDSLKCDVVEVAIAKRQMR